MRSLLNLKPDNNLCCVADKQWGLPLTVRHNDLMTPADRSLLDIVVGVWYDSCRSCRSGRLHRFDSAIWAIRNCPAVGIRRIFSDGTFVICVVGGLAIGAVCSRAESWQ